MHTFFRERKYAKKAFTNSSRAVSSPGSFLSVRGVRFPAPSKPNNVTHAFRHACFLLVGQALGLLVPVSSIHYCTSTSGLSTRSSSWALTPFRGERSHLRGSFTLRCFQRLSRPYLATQLCRWHDNWCTRGTSIPVLSY